MIGVRLAKLAFFLFISQSSSFGVIKCLRFKFYKFCMPDPMGTDPMGNIFMGILARINEPGLFTDRVCGRCEAQGMRLWFFTANAL